MEQSDNLVNKSGTVAFCDKERDYVVVNCDDGKSVFLYSVFEHGATPEEGNRVTFDYNTKTRRNTNIRFSEREQEKEEEMEFPPPEEPDTETPPPEEERMSDEEFYRGINLDSVEAEERLRAALEQDALAGYDGLTEADIDFLRENDRIANERYEELYGFNPEKEEPSKHKEEFQKTEKAAAQAARNGAENEGVKEVIDMNALSYKEYLEARKTEILGKDAIDRVKDIESRTLSAMQKTRKYLENLNDRGIVMTKSMAHAIAAPIRQRILSKLEKKAVKQDKRVERYRRKQKSAFSKIDAKAKKRMDKDIAAALKKGKPVPQKDLRDYRTEKEQDKLDVITRRLQTATTGAMAIQSAIERRLAVEAAKNATIKAYRDQIRKRVYDLRHAATNPEKAYVSEMKKRMDDIEKTAGQEYLDMYKKEHGEIENGASFKDIVQNVDIRLAEDRTTKMLDMIERDMKDGDTIDLKTDNMKYRMYKDNETVYYERWDNVEHRFEDTSKLDTISAFAKDQKYVTKKIGELKKEEKTTTREDMEKERC